MRHWILAASIVLGACSADETPKESLVSDVLASVREEALAGNSQVSQKGHYFGYGLQIDGIADCSEIDRTAGPIGFRHCVANNVAVVEKQLDRADAVAPGTNAAAELKAWKARTIEDCERKAETGGWSGGSDFWLVVNDCYGRRMVKKFVELKDVNQ
jgi:hypothetical protein